MDSPRIDLLPWSALYDVIRVLEHGEIKHPGDEWRNTPIADHVRHMLGHVLASGHIGAVRDEESGEYHLAHAVARGLFALAKLKVAHRPCDTVREI